MGFIFNRPISYNGYEAALEAWANSTNPKKELADYDKAMAINLRYDYRVTDVREQNFRKIFEDNGKNLKYALDAYYEQFVDRPKTLPDFCHLDNRIADCSSGICWDGFNFNDDLVTVMNLNGLMLRLKDANNNLSQDLPLWDKLITLGISNALTNPNLFSDWLTKQLTVGSKTKAGNDPDVLSVIHGFFEILKHDVVNRPDEHKYPVWVTKWDLFKEVAFAKKHNGDDYIDRWNQVVGVNRRYPTWQIIVKYPTSEVKCLYRPSQLDGGIYPQHFPRRPIPSFPANGGHTVDLASKIATCCLNFCINQSLLNRSIIKV